jgi:23S rRNA (guanine745-N1)-methyltransferase
LAVLADVVSVLRCPHCFEDLHLNGRALRCANGHSFDVAKQGYVSLLTGHPAAVPGDTAAMVAARETFLSGGHFSVLTGALAEAVRAHLHAATSADTPEAGGARAAEPEAAGTPERGAGGKAELAAAGASELGTADLGGASGRIVDLGGGTGHHLAGVLDANPRSVGVVADVSAYALRRAAKAHPRIGAIRCDTWRPLPLRTGAADVVLNVFAPRNGAEIHRALHPTGVLVVVVPTDRHLRELAAAVGEVRVDPRKADRLDAALGSHFTLASDSEAEAALSLTPEEALMAVEMGPAAWHAEPAVLRSRLAGLPSPIATTASVRVAVFRPV